MMATMLYNVVPLGAFCIHVLLRRILHDSQKKQVSNQHLGNVVLVIDIGSSSVRCSPYNISIENPNDIRLLVECTQKITYNLNQVNRKLIDEKGNESYPSTQILKIVDAVVSRCIHSLRCHGKDSVSINAIGISSFAMNIFGVNDSGDVCTPLFTYATSSTPTNATTTFSSIQALGSEAEKNNKMCVVIPTQEKEEKCHLSEFSSHLATTGTRLNHQSYAIAQLRSYTSEFPRESAAVAHWSTLSSMFISQWTEPIDPTTTVKTVEISPLSSIQPINVPFSSVSSSSSSSFDNDDMKNSTISPVSYSEASWMGLLNFKTRKWDEKSLSLSLINDTKLPPLTTFKILNNRKISSNVLLLYPELKNAVFYPGIGDGAAATVGTNCIGRNRISVTIGTSAAVRIIINDNNNNSNNNNTEDDNNNINDYYNNVNNDNYDKNGIQNLPPENEILSYKTEGSILPPPGLFCYRLDDERLLVGGALTDGGSLLDWFKNLIGDDRYNIALNDIESMYQSSSTDVLGGSTQKQFELFSTTIFNHRVDSSTQPTEESVIFTDRNTSRQKKTNTDKEEDKEIEINTSNPKNENGNKNEMRSDFQFLSKSVIKIMNPVNVLPFWSGERSTGWNDSATGVISGISHNSTASSILLGIMEGLAYRISMIILLMRDSGLIDSAENAILIASGCALENSLLLKQMIVNFCGYDMICLRDEGKGELTSYGIAKLISESYHDNEKKEDDVGEKDERDEESKSKIFKLELKMNGIEKGKRQLTKDDTDEKGNLKKVNKELIYQSHSQENNFNVEKNMKMRTSLPGTNPPSKKSGNFGFKKSEILSITKPQCAESDVEYIQKRIKENSKLYSDIFSK